MTYGRYQDISVRPLNKGMFTDLPRNGIPLGGFESIKNLHVDEGYLETRGGMYPLFNGSIDLSGDDLIAYDYANLREKIIDVVYHWKVNGQSETLIISSEFLYQYVDRTQLTYTYIVSETITGTAVEDSPYWTLTVTGGDYSDITVGDYVRPSGGGDVFGKVVSVDGADITFEVDPSYTGTPTSVEFIYTFTVDPGYKVDHTILGGYGTAEAGNEMILTDQSGRGVYRYSDGTLELYDIDSTPLGRSEYSTDEDYENAQTFRSAKACTFFDDRLFLGNVTETTGNTFAQRIWWSDSLDYDRFDPASYLDLPYSQGELLAIKPLGPNLILYFSDTIYIGRPTQISGRPYEFQEMNTNQIGLVSQKALATYDDGHFFVGQDDVYYLTGSGGLTRVGTPVKEQTVKVTRDLGMLDYVQVSSDPMAESVAFIFPDTSDEIADQKGLATKIWRFSYKPQAWSFDEVPIINDVPQAYFSSLSAARTVAKRETYEDWQNREPVPTDGDPQTQTSDYTVEWLGDETLEAVYKEGDEHDGQEEWENIESYDDLNSFSISEPRLLIGLYYLDTTGYFVQNIVYFNPNLDQDEINSVLYDITFELISPDYDFGYPDSDKLTRQFSIRTFEHADEYFQPTVWTSDGKSRLNTAGQQEIWWMKAPTVKFFTNYNEGRTGFLTRGSIFKFKVQFTRSTERYRLSEIIIRTKVEGVQVDL